MYNCSAELIFNVLVLTLWYQIETRMVEICIHACCISIWQMSACFHRAILYGNLFTDVISLFLSFLLFMRIFISHSFIVHLLRLEL